MRGPLARIQGLGPAGLILGASILSGASGYLVTILVAAALDAADYAVFAVFWSALYLAVGAFGGVQQEITRSTTRSEAAPGPSRPGMARVAVFASVLAVGTTVVLASTAVVWAPVVLGRGTDAVAAGIALAVGVGSYIVVAAVAGAFYGARWWVPIAALILIDGLTRLVVVAAALVTSASAVWLTIAVIAPFPLALLAVGPFVARRLRRSTRADVGYRALTWNTTRTVVAAASTAVIVSGFPVLLSVTSAEVPRAALGPIVLAVTLTRAPIVIPLLALQSYLVVRFTGRPPDLRRLTALVGAVIVAGIALAGVAALVGPAVFEGLFGAALVVDGVVLFVVVASSGLVAALCISGPVLLALSAHSAYVLGWLVAAAATVLLLLVPSGLEARACLALVGGPLAGLIVQLVAVRLPRLTDPPTAPAN
ncbi:MAG: hypothetical protein RI885_2654 [Actinomycetota bacterium]